MSESLPAAYFDRLYEQSPDPWNFEQSGYEAEKYARTLAALPRSGYASALEVGCSIGVFTALLAPRCRALLSIDSSRVALDKAIARCRALPQVRFEQMSVPGQFPRELFDLIVLSEVGYYLAPADLQQLADHMAEHSDQSGQVLLVHWRPRVPDYPLTGDQVHEYFRNRSEWRVLASSQEERYRIDVLEKRMTAAASSEQTVASVL